MRRRMLCLFAGIVAVTPCIAETPDKDQRTRALALQKLAIEAKELIRCTAIVSVEDLSGFEPIMKAYNKKTDELARAIEDFVARFASQRAKHETVLGFKYRVWDMTLQAGAENARPSSALNREICGALSR